MNFLPILTRAVAILLFALFLGLTPVAHAGFTAHNVVYKPVTLSAGEAFERHWSERGILILTQMVEANSSDSWFGGLTGSMSVIENRPSGRSEQYDINWFSRFQIRVGWSIDHQSFDQKARLGNTGTVGNRVTVDITSSTLAQKYDEKESLWILAACFYSIVLNSPDPVHITLYGAPAGSPWNKLTGEYTWSAETDSVPGGIAGFILRRDRGIYYVVPVDRSSPRPGGPLK